MDIVFAVALLVCKRYIGEYVFSPRAMRLRNHTAVNGKVVNVSDLIVNCS